MSIGFRDHEGFHRAALGMVGVGAAAGLVAHALRLSSVHGMAPALLGGAVGAVVGAALASREDRRRRLAGGLVLLAAGCAAAALIPGWRGVALLAVSGALALHGGTPLPQRVVGTLVGSAALVIAAFAGLQVEGAQELASWPSWLVSGLGAAASSFVSVAALAPRHVVVERDAIDAAARGLPAALDGEVRELVDRGRAVWSEVRDRLAADPASRDLVRDGVLRLVEVARRSGELPVDLAASASRIAARLTEIDARASAATDEITAAQYRQARTSLEDQQRDLDAIRTGRERLVARMHNYLAGLERFRLAVIKHQAVSASNLAAEARPLLGEISELAAELDASATV